MKFKNYKDALHHVFDLYKINSPDRSAFEIDIIYAAMLHLQLVLPGDSDLVSLRLCFRSECQLGSILKHDYKYYKPINQCSPAIAITCDLNAPAVNDHICPTCKNTRCSKTEKTCWLCGNNLH